MSQGWENLKAAAAQVASEVPALEGVLAALDEIWSPPAWSPTTGQGWAAWLREVWQRLEFPGSLEEMEKF